MPSVGDLRLRELIIHQSERTRVTRIYVPGGSVIRKEPLGPDAESRVRHELSFLERLRGVQGIAQLAVAPRYPGSIVLQDTGGTALAERMKPLAADALIELALAVTRAVAGMHARGVLHRDISPTNIVVSGDGVPCLIDFALATSLAEFRPAFAHQSEIVGTLAYLAPEQTGRTARPVDRRSDLYALGATFYELATGQAPFGARDPLQLIHDQLTRVPTAPVDLTPTVPAAFSEIVMHLLEKEPDDRYQTADGLVHDLERLREAGARPAEWRIAERDVPPRLLPPSRLLGRDAEIAELETAFDEAMEGQCSGLLVGGAPGVGKSALVDELRRVVAERRGWFVAGKFDQYRRDLEFDGLNQAFRSLGRLLLALPEDELARVRDRLLRALGPNAGYSAAAVPEFAAVLAVAPENGDPFTAEARAQRDVVVALREMASRERPLVLFLDDLQWTGRTALAVVNALLSGEPIAGLLFVGAYREDEMDVAHPVGARLGRWRRLPGVRHLPLRPLSGADVALMLAEMLHVTRAAAAGLADAIEPHAHGIPFDTVELLNELRRDGLLMPNPAGWQWDAGAIHEHLARSDVAALLSARVGSLPPPTRRLIGAMASLGGRVELSVLQAATGQARDVVERKLGPALQEGVLVVEPGIRPAMRFRHDRLREAVLAQLDPVRRRKLQLTMARRLAKVPELYTDAAVQYLPTIDSIQTVAERRHVVGLLRRAAGQAELVGEFGLVEPLLAAALRLIDPDEIPELLALHTGRHAALFSVGRLEEADDEFRTIEALSRSSAERAAATAVQVRSLTHRNRLAEAIDLSVNVLRELGIALPEPDELPSAIDRHFEHLYRWLEETSLEDDLTRPELSDPTLLAAAPVMNALETAAHFADLPNLTAWVGLEAIRIWLRQGPARALLGPAIHAPYAAAVMRQDYLTAYRTARRILAVAEGRDYEPDTSQVRLLCHVLSCWFEPIEACLALIQRAREGLIAGGDLAHATFSYYDGLAYVLDCESLETCIAEAEAGLAFARRTGSEQSTGAVRSYQWLSDVLRDRGAASASETAPTDAVNRTVLLLEHLNRAIAAAIFGDLPSLSRHTAATLPLLPAEVNYTVALVRMLRALALAAEVREAGARECAGHLAELDEITRWLAARAVDAPDNFTHLLRLVEAEREWALGNFQSTAMAFDAARRAVARRQRPWHRALIAEHAGRFYLGHGLDQAGLDLLADARDEYHAWGATAKVSQLDWAYPALRLQSDARRASSSDDLRDLSPRRSAITAGTIDLLGILSASRALSSEHSIDRLRARLSQVLGALTGATDVHLLLWSDDAQRWLSPTSVGGREAHEDSGHTEAFPVSVPRYLQRTGEPLLVDDAVRDERFARDPYFAGIDRCSLLAVPIANRGVLQAVLLLENRLIRGAFTIERLEAVKLIAGQLAVSLDNAQVYADFQRVAGEQAALQRVATLVARGVPPDEVFAAVAEEAGRLVSADMAMIGRYGAGPSVTAVVAWRSDGSDDAPLGRDVPLGGDNIMSRVFAQGGPVRIEDYSKASGALAELGRASRMGSAVGVPIVVEGHVWGVMMISLEQERPWPPDTEERLADFTELAATAIANAEAREELRRVADQQAALRRVATLVAQGVAPDDLFAAVAKEVSHLLPAVERALIGRYTSDGSIEFVGATIDDADWVGRRVGLGGHNAATAVFESNRSARIDHYLAADTSAATDAARGGGSRSAAGAPISVEGKLWGVIIVASTQEAGLPAGTEDQLAAFTELVATAIANAQSRRELTTSRARIVASADETRRRIVRDLHDGAQHRLVQTIITLNLGLRAHDKNDGDTARGLFADALSEAEQANAALRELAQGILPSVLARGGLAASVEELVERLRVPATLTVTGDRFRPEIEANTYFVIAEALTNMAKHSHAGSATVAAWIEDEVLHVDVSDDGVGGANPEGSGLRGLADRVGALGGELRIESPTGGGTRIFATFPL